MDDQNKSPLDAYLNSEGTVDPKIAKELERQVAQEDALQAKYGDNATEAFVGQALSTATLGLSDQMLRKLGVSAERLRETRERSPTASMLGTGTGIVAPALVGNEGPLAAKVIGKAGAPLKATSAAASGTEKIVEGLLKDRVRSNAVKQIVKTAASGAVEGAALSLGELVSEDALDKAELNGQNIVAYAGSGALLGAGFGAGLGAAKAVAPVIGKGTIKLKDQLVNASKRVTDPELAAAELIGLRADKLDKISQTNKTFKQELPSYITQKLELKPTSTAEELVLKNRAVKAEASAAIKEVSEKLDIATTLVPEALPARASAYDRLLNVVTSFEDTFASTRNANRAELRLLNDFSKDLQKLKTNGLQTSFKELDDLRKTYQGMSYKGDNALDSFKSKVAEKLRQELRGIVDEAAESISAKAGSAELQQLAQKLKSANADFHMSSIVDRYLPKKLNQKALLNLQDIAEGTVFGTLGGPKGIALAGIRKFTQSDLRRRLAVLADIRLQNEAIEARIGEALKNFATKAQRPSRQAALKTLLNSGFALSETREAPKNKTEAFVNISTNINKLASDPDHMVERLAKTTSGYIDHAPQSAQEAQNTLVRAAQFLASKLPSNLRTTDTLFPRPVLPSGIEMAKFQRYMQAVEAPLSVLTDVENGTLTHEHVEALQVVYPAVYRQIQQKAIDMVAEHGEKMSINKRIQLGVLLNIPTTEALKPQNIAGLQASFVTNGNINSSQQGANTAVKSTVSGLQGISKSDRLSTETQRVQGGD